MGRAKRASISSPPFGVCEQDVWISSRTHLITDSTSFSGKVKRKLYHHRILIQAECVRCPWLLAETKVATILGIFPLVLVGVTTAIHRRVCHRVPKFCMGS